MSLKLIPSSPKKSLNAAFLKVRPLRSEIDIFKENLINLLDKVDESEREENQKNQVRDFLVNTYYKGKNEVNTKGTIDLVIHTDNTNKSSIGVIIEAKRPSNKSEWITVEKPNGKALQEAVLYYMREREDENNIDVKHIVLTNIYEWYLFDAVHFDKLFYQNKKFVKDYQAWSSGQKVSSDTSLFYNDIAKPFIDSLQEEVPCTYFDLRTYEKELRNTDNADDKKLIELQKLLSEFHLLKVPFANDSNKLDKRFYAELLHIIGLTEIKDGGKKLIGRHKVGERMMGSILEDTIMQLDARDKLSRVKNISQYGTTTEERLFNVALELTITWVNRILFLKLLEGQLLSYHKGNKEYLFLNHQVIREFDQLDALFFQVLAKRFKERNEHVSKLFNHVPYLNSSLFEPTELEHDTLFISNLSDDKTLPIHAQSVLKSANGTKRSGELSTLEYLFAFLDAYDFSGEGSEDIQEDNKPLINASVLGLIFEKINGYKDGSFFTPGFITMYMCRETIRRAVVQKFNEAKGWQCETLDHLYDKIEDRTEANALINGIKICDPAVGSGHFLVSALNEVIAIKSDLKILQDRKGKRLRDYVVEVVNDELIVKDEDGELYHYNPLNEESQRIQETLFHEKQTIIENCLFGVDINPNSVKICRLRLWIELLKNAYYKTKTELETLPNIDINIKCGNSLISRFAIDADMKDVLKKAKQWNIQSYKLAVDGYRNAKTKEVKREFESLIDQIKTDFKSEVDKPFMKKISEARGKAENIAIEITNLTTFGQKIDPKLQKNLEAATTTLTKLEADRLDILQNKIFDKAFEWRFEFPEVLNDDGDFVGFDVVIGNPPYIQLQSMKEVSEQLEIFEYKTYEKTGDIYSLFYERGNTIIKDNGLLGYITSNKWMRAGYGKTTRNYFLKFTQPQLLIDLGSGIFEEATVDSNLFLFKKSNYSTGFKALDITKEKHVKDLTLFEGNYLKIDPKIDENWTISSTVEQNIKTKIESSGKPLKHWDININYGIKTGYNEAFVISRAKKEELIAEDPKSEEIIKPLLRGRDIKLYHAEFADLWLLYIPWHFPLQNNKNVKGNSKEAEVEFEKQYPAVFNHLLIYKDKLLARNKAETGIRYEWFALQRWAADYYQEFEKEKIIFQEMVQYSSFIYDENENYFCLDTGRIITGKNLKFLIAILNSKLFFFAVKNFYGGGGLGETGVRMKHSFFENFVLKELSLDEQRPFIYMG
jgi:adenine-specific DNA-methyltransferase